MGAWMRNPAEERKGGAPKGRWKWIWRSRETTGRSTIPSERRRVPAEAYYGVQTLRAAENFYITGLKMHPELINQRGADSRRRRPLPILRWASWTSRGRTPIVKACDEIIQGKLHDQFIVDPIQGGAGTSLNMNANEVIANRAIEILGGEKGDYSLVNPNDHVNFGQSTNDVFPSCGKMAALKLLGRGEENQLIRLEGALEQKAAEFDHVIKMGRTQLQDAVPIRLGQEFRAYSTAVRRDVRRFENAKDELRSLKPGGHSHRNRASTRMCSIYKRVVKNISILTGQDLVHQSYDLIDAHPEPGQLRLGVGDCEDPAR